MKNRLKLFVSGLILLLSQSAFAITLESSRSTSTADDNVYRQSGQMYSKSDRHYVSTTDDISAILIKDNGILELINSSIKTTGNTSSGEKSSFYGLNAGVLVKSGASLVLKNCVVGTQGEGANGIFAYGKSTATMFGGSIYCTGRLAHAVMVSGGGTLIVANVDMTTTGANSAAIATDRGSGTVTVRGGKIKTTGEDSPCIYSTGEIMVVESSIVATGSEAAVIEGDNSITFNKVKISGAKKCGVMILQSMSGDAQGSTGRFTMTDGSLSVEEGALFFVTNASANITLKNVKLSSTKGKLIDASASRWGKKGANGGQANLVAESQILYGTMVCDDISSITVNLTNKTIYTGSIKTAALTIDKKSTWVVTADSYLSSLVDADASLSNIKDNGHTIYYKSDLPDNVWLGGKTIYLKGGGKLTPQ